MNLRHACENSSSPTSRCDRSCTTATEIAIRRAVAAYIERDYQDLKQEFGLDHYEGRGWRGFHHHASLCIAAYGFLMAERLAAEKPDSVKKNFLQRQTLVVPNDYIPRGSPARTASRPNIDSDTAPMPVLRTIN
jgi:hypothetical protein